MSYGLGNRYSKKKARALGEASAEQHAPNERDGKGNPKGHTSFAGADNVPVEDSADEANEEA